MAIRIEGYNHVAIVVSNLEACKRFYGDILGLKGAQRPAFNFPGHWYQVDPNTQLHLMVFEEVIPSTMRHFALVSCQVSNVATIFQPPHLNPLPRKRGRGSMKEYAETL